MSSRNDDLRLRDFMFRGLLFEAEASNLRRAGIEIGSEQAIVQEASLIREAISPFSISLRANALEMTRLYALLYCFENSIRQLIDDRLVEKFGQGWWETKTPSKVKQQAETRRTRAMKNTWLEGESRSLLAFAEFGDLAAIITANWEHFSDLIPNQQWLTQRLGEIEEARNFIAHNRMLQPSEFQRLYMYIGDWNRQVGF